MSLSSHAFPLWWRASLNRRWGDWFVYVFIEEDGTLFPWSVVLSHLLNRSLQPALALNPECCCCCLAPDGSRWRLMIHLWKGKDADDEPFALCREHPYRPVTLDNFIVHFMIYASKYKPCLSCLTFVLLHHMILHFWFDYRSPISRLAY